MSKGEYMKTGKSLIAGVCTAAMILGMTGCGAEKTATTAANESETTTELTTQEGTATGTDLAELKEEKWLEEEIKRTREGGALEAAFTTVAMTEKEVPIYYNSLDDKENITLAFFDEDGSVPYINVSDIPGVLEKAYRINKLDTGYKLTFSSQDSTATLTRENGAWAKIDCDKDTITFLDYDEFFRPSNQEKLMDVISENSLKSEDATKLFKHNEKALERNGDAAIISAADYGIDLVKEEENYYIPFATVSDFILDSLYMPAIYNGKSMILYEAGGLEGEFLELSDMGKLYYEGDIGKVSPSMAHFSYNELCMMLDYHYGLKEVHNISSFDKAFLETGLKTDLLSEDPKVSETALAKFIALYLDDLHSRFTRQSYHLGEYDFIEFEPGESDSSYDELREVYSKVRDEAYPDGMPAYEEVGNTAYITFDSFEDISEGIKYYDNTPTDASMDDTLGLMMYAYSQINREGSPVENVVLDISLNSGGESAAAAYVIGAFLGNGYYSLRNEATGSMVTDSYQIDLNLDHKFDEKDSFKGCNLYCLTSPVSFSCGNFVPNVFKNSNQVKLIGQTSGGGSCMVLPATTASGAEFRVSGEYKLAFTKNGSFYDIDTGAEPDYYIGNIGNYYNRQALTDYINGLF